MKQLALRVALVLVVCGITCWGQTVLDPLMGYCAGAGQCKDNGTNSPTSTNPPANFGFTIAPGPNTGDLLIDILVPNNLQNQSSYSISGTFAGNATLFGTTEWSSGSLAPFLGLSASPNNAIGAYLPSTQALDPGATGFSVYQLDAGMQTLQGPSNPNVSPLLNLGSPLRIGSYIVAFLNTGSSTSPSWQATSNSGAIFETKDAPPVPEPSAIILLGSVTLGIATLLKRKAQGRV